MDGQTDGRYQVHYLPALRWIITAAGVDVRTHKQTCKELDGQTDATKSKSCYMVDIQFISFEHSNCL